MTITTSPADACPNAPEAFELAKDLSEFRGSNLKRSMFELFVTAISFVALWSLALWSYDHSYWLTLLFSIPAGAFLVRLFMIQHDCGHGAFFRYRRPNDWVGRVIGVLTLTPYDIWKKSHAIHHASSGNLDQRGIGDITTLTVEEYSALSWLGKLQYRLYRHPLVMFGLGPAYLFLLQHRLPVGHMRGGWRPWTSVMVTNVAIVVLFAAMAYLIGPWKFIAIQLPVTLFAASAGVWLFYVQHQYDETQWAKTEDWNVHEFALHGSSYYELPPVLRWMSANIGMHHIHHLCARIPFYRLPEVLTKRPELGSIGKLTVRESLASVKLSLWDEDRKRLISFSELPVPVRV